MMFMNEFDIESAIHNAARQDLPNLHTAAMALGKLMDWANSNSDGWAYWPKPARAASKLMSLFDDRLRSEDCTEAEVKKALTPVKAFLTRQGVPHATVLEG